MLIFWTGAGPDILNKTIGVALRSFRPNVPEHKFVQWKEGDPVPHAAPGDVILACG
jgi:hypothetical protein